MGPIMYIIAHHDLPQCFEDPTHVHAYVDDIAIIHRPSIHLKFKFQINDIEKRINKNLVNLLKYANKWHQPSNPSKTEIVMYHRTVQCPRLNVYYDGVKIQQNKDFKYLGFHLDAKLSFRYLIDAQTIKMRKAYNILKYIHKQFPSFFKVKIKFFNTFIWPHLYMMGTTYCLFSRSSRERIAGFYQRCMKLIYYLFECSSEDLHQRFQLPTIEQKYTKCLRKRLKNIQI